MSLAVPPRPVDVVAAPDARPASAEPLTARFRRAYLPGFDCRLACARNAFAAAGVPLSPAAALGLSGALCFAYATPDTNRFPCHSVAGISDQTVSGLAAALGAYVWAGRLPADAPFAGSPPHTLLAAGWPVHVAVHRGTLRRVTGTGAPPRDDVGAHFVSLTGYDADARRFTLFETDAATPLEVEAAELRGMWHADATGARPMADPTLPCDGHWFALGVLPPVASTALWRSAVPHALHRVVRGFMHAPLPTMGAAALATFAADVPTWPALVDGDAPLVTRSVRLLGVTVGPLSGGGLGRRLFARFLREVARRWPAPPLSDAAAAFDATAAAWSGFAADAIDALRVAPAQRAAALERVVAPGVPALAALEAAQFARLAEALADAGLAPAGDA